MTISGRLGTSGLDSSVASMLRASSEPLTLIQEAAGTLDVATQVVTPGASTSSSIYGTVALVESGLDGVTVQRGDLELWIPSLLFDDLGSSLAVGDVIVRDRTGQKLTVLEAQALTPFGVTKAHARGIS